jgi:transcriptional regulator GlxA family with amidase domain
MARSVSAIRADSAAGVRIAGERAANGLALPQRGDVRTREVVFVLLPNLVLLDLAGPADAFRNAASRVPGSYRLHFVAPQSEVLAAGGLKFSNLAPLPTHFAPDTILVLIGCALDAVDPHDPATAQVIRWLRSSAKPALLLCVCAGSVLAGYAGLLAGRDCTTHHACIEELRRVEPSARVHDNRIFVEDGTVLTSAGVTAGLDLALHVIAQQIGPLNSASIARDLVVYLRRAGSDPALSPWVMHRNHLHPAVHRVQEAVTREPTARWRASDLADVACTSPRNLTRLFAEHAQCTPLDYVQLIRFAFARELVMQSQLTVEQVAARAGFRSAQHLRRVWARWESQPPSAFRKSSAQETCGR